MTTADTDQNRLFSESDFKSLVSLFAEGAAAQVLLGISTQGHDLFDQLDKNADGTIARGNVLFGSKEDIDSCSQRTSSERHFLFKSHNGLDDSVSESSNRASQCNCPHSSCQTWDCTNHREPSKF